MTLWQPSNYSYSRTEEQTSIVSSKVHLGKVNFLNCNKYSAAQRHHVYYLFCVYVSKTGLFDCTVCSYYDVQPCFQ